MKELIQLSHSINFMLNYEEVQLYNVPTVCVDCAQPKNGPKLPNYVKSCFYFHFNGITFKSFRIFCD